MPSCLDTLAELAAAGAPAGACVLAEHQSAGRGRRGRCWESPPGASLLIALLLPPVWEPRQLGLVSLASACAWVQSLASFGVELTVKWPNDLLWSDLKVGGILPEARLGGERCRQLLLGAGVNVHQGGEGFPPPPAGAQSLDRAAGRRLSRRALLAAWLLRLEALLHDLEAGREAAVLDAWRSAWPHRGRLARDERGRLLRLLDLDALGRMRVQGPAGPETLAAGELSLRVEAAGDASGPADESGTW